MGDGKGGGGVGECGKTCGVFAGSYAVVGPVEVVVPVDVFVVGCPPEPADILAGILRALDRFAGPRPGAAVTRHPQAEVVR